MRDSERRSRRLRHLKVLNQARRAVTAAVMTASETKLRDSHRLIAAGLLIIERSDARRTASGLSQLSRIEPDDDSLAEVLPAMIRFREILCDGDKQALLGDVLDTVTRATRTDLGNIQLLDVRRGTLQIVAHRGFGAEFLDFFGEVHGEGAACGAALRARQRVIVEDVAPHPIFAGRSAQPILLRAGVRAVQSTPLMTRSGALVGMLSTHFRSPHRVPVYKLRLIDIVSRQVAELIRAGAG